MVSYNDRLLFAAIEGTVQSVAKASEKIASILEEVGSQLHQLIRRIVCK